MRKYLLKETKWVELGWKPISSLGRTLQNTMKTKYNIAKNTVDIHSDNTGDNSNNANGNDSNNDNDNDNDNDNINSLESIGTSIIERSRHINLWRREEKQILLISVKVFVLVATITILLKTR